jgi:flagellar motor component MotA
MAGLAAGGLGTMTGWIIILKNLDDPVAIGPGMAISLLTVMYGLILAFVIALPLQTKLTPGERDASASRGATFAILLSALLSISMYSILALPFATTG